MGTVVIRHCGNTAVIEVGGDVKEKFDTQDIEIADHLLEELILLVLTGLKFQHNASSLDPSKHTKTRKSTDGEWL